MIPLKYEIDKTEVEQEIANPEEIEGEMVATLPMEDFLDWDTRKTTGVLGFTPLIERESVPRLLKLEKSYKLFGQKENVTRVGIAYRPLIEIGVQNQIWSDQKEI